MGAFSWGVEADITQIRVSNTFVGGAIAPCTTQREARIQPRDLLRLIDMVAVYTQAMLASLTSRRHFNKQIFAGVDIESAWLAALPVERSKARPGPCAIEEFSLAQSYSQTLSTKAASEDSESECGEKS